MPVDYTNNAYDKVISNLRKTLGGELKTAIYLDEHKGSNSILITLEEDTLLEVLANAQQRQYTINIQYQLNVGGLMNAKHFKQVSNMAEHIKKLFAPDQNSLDGTDYFGGRVETITYEKLEDESKFIANITLTLKVLET